MAGDSPHFKVGDQVRYRPVVPENSLVYLEIPATVIGVTKTRIVIQLTGTTRPISVKKTSVARPRPNDAR